MLTWVMLEGLDSHLMELFPEEISQWSTTKPVMIEDSNQALAFFPRTELATNALQRLLTGTSHEDATKFVEDSLARFDNLSPGYHEAGDIHVFGLLAEKKHKVGFSHLVQVLERLVKLKFKKIHLHLILPPTKELSFLLPMDCLYQLEHWISQNNQDTEVVIASFAGSDHALYEPYAYLQTLKNPSKKTSFSQMKNALQNFLKAGYADSNVPVCTFDRATPFTHKSLALPISTFKPLLDALIHFTSRDHVTLTHQLFLYPPAFFKATAENHKLSIFDLSPEHTMTRYLEETAPELVSLVAPNAKGLYPSERADLHIVYSDTIGRAIHTGLKKLTRSAVHGLMAWLKQNVNEKEKTIVSGISASTYSLHHWGIHTTAPRVPVWFDANRQTNAGNKKLRPQDLAPTLLDRLGIPLLPTMTGKSFAANL